MKLFKYNVIFRRLMSSSSAPDFHLLRVQKELVSIWEYEWDKQFSNAILSNPSTFENSEYFSASGMIRWNHIDREMSSNVAGETGAVWIYKGALAATRFRKNCDEIKEFANEHMKAEQQHLDYFTDIIPEHMHTSLLPIWKFCGFMLGFLPTLIGKGPALYHTVDAVESFVEIHYNEQIEWLKEFQKDNPNVLLRAIEVQDYDKKSIDELRKSERYPEIIRLLSHCCADEVHHKLDARRRLLGLCEEKETYTGVQNDDADLNYGLIAKTWRIIVTFGSIYAAALARRI